MTRAEWNSIEVGAVLRFPRRDGSYVLRTVMALSRFGSRVHGITIPIMRRSWTGRIHTTRFFGDCQRAELHPKSEDRLMTDIELGRLCDRGFDIPACLHRERRQFGSLQTTESSKLMGAAAVARAFCK